MSHRTPDQAALEQRIRQLGSEILLQSQAATDSAKDRLVEWAMRDGAVRTALFRFVDVLPALRNSADVIRHAQEYLAPVADGFPGIAPWGLKLHPHSLPAKAAAAIIQQQVRSLAARFILGETPADALPALRGIRKAGMTYTVDLLGEAVVSEREADDYLARYLDLVGALADAALPVRISVKLSALYSQARPVAFQRTVAALSDRLAAIVREAIRRDGAVCVDMEHTGLTDITLETVRRVFCSAEFRDNDRLGFVLQAYLRRTERDLAGILHWLRQRGAPVAIRLVKGAYWDTETAQAQLKNWPIPVWRQKANTDAAFEKLSRALLDHRQLVFPAFASHNVRSLCHAIAYAEQIGLHPTAFELQVLRGMADSIAASFAKRGYRLRQYCPIGPLLPGMAYLVRRLLENTSNVGFLRRSSHQTDPATLLAAPSPQPEPVEPSRCEFRNCPLRDFTIESNRHAIQAALDRFTMPPQPEPVTRQHAQAALQSLRDFFPAWRDTPVEQRAAILVGAAEILQTRRAELTALIIHEAGKPWTGADADVAEAIDFLNYYARQAATLFAPQRSSALAGEDNRYSYEPRGVCAVIGPWNFPLAIPAGMFSAALVTGNCAALKPAGPTPRIARELYRAFLDAGLPPQAAAFLPGRGSEVGAALVNSPLVSTIVFTGSKEIGLRILAEAARVQPGQEHVKRVIAEMGSKNAIIIYDDADLDDAVKGVIESAFGYAGQKCSACSRVVVVEGVYDRFMSRLADATRSLAVGPATDPATFVGPVINAEAYERLTGVIAEAKRTCRLVAESQAPETGRFVAPVVFDEIPPGHPLLTTELFGPVLAAVKVPDFDAALRVALDTEYGLTGGVFSRSPAILEKAAREFRVGNLYLNRECTGALVGRQPFGGARMSGVGSKAGGPDYLLQFVIPRTVTENTLRKGFAPFS
jgi:RHH-type proline utilization regulon transcriptional repressor/proline dehydrogenase/delta 1-pyrroline-5-carboxylate dehydrogenase